MRRCISIRRRRTPTLLAFRTRSGMPVFVHPTIAVTLRWEWPGGLMILIQSWNVFVIASSRHDDGEDSVV